MPFQKGNKLSPGRKRGTSDHKKWLLNEMVSRAQMDPEQFRLELDELRKSDLGKYLELLIKMFPKEHNLGGNINLDISSEQINATIQRIQRLMVTESMEEFGGQLEIAPGDDAVVIDDVVIINGVKLIETT